jgi:hypothetical protein
MKYEDEPPSNIEEDDKEYPFVPPIPPPEKAYVPKPRKTVKNAMVIKPFYTIKEIAALLGTSHTALYLKHYRKTIDIPFSKLGTINVVYISDLKEKFPELYNSICESVFVNSFQVSSIETQRLMKELEDDDL